MYRAAAVLLVVGYAFAQTPQSPQDLLKDAVAAQQSGNFDQAIRNYRLILEKYPAIPEIRSNLGAALGRTRPLCGSHRGVSNKRYD